MNLQLKPEFKTEFPILNSLIEKFSSDDTIINNKLNQILDQIGDVKEFEKKLGLLRFSMLNFTENSFLQNEAEFLSAFRFVYEEREKILLTRYGISVREPQRHMPQSRPPILTSEAYIPKGNNKTGLVENKSIYSSIYE